MDREQEEMQFLGLVGIYNEAFKIIHTWRKVFAQITTTLILPLSFIFLMHIEVSHILLRKIKHNAIQITGAQPGTPQYDKLSDVISSEWTALWLFRLAYYTVCLVLSLLCTAAVVYTIASIYTGRDITFKKVMSVVPKVWKRLMITFLCTFSFFFIYMVVSLVAYGIVIIVLLTMGVKSAGLRFMSGIILILYLAGFIYMTMIWNLASVVSVLEDSCGISAMMKSKNLIKGKMGVALVIFFMLILSYILLQILFHKFVVNGWRVGSIDRTAYGVLCLLLLSGLFLLGLVIQTVIYFVCKSYHHENIDKSALSDHLEVYLGEYTPLKAKDVQLEQYQV